MKLPFRLGLRGELTLLLAIVMLVVAALFAALWLHTRGTNAEARELSADAVRELAREGLLMRGHTLSSQLADAATNPSHGSAAEHAHRRLDHRSSAARGAERAARRREHRGVARRTHGHRDHERARTSCAGQPRDAQGIGGSRAG